MSSLACEQAFVKEYKQQKDQKTVRGSSSMGKFVSAGYMLTISLLNSPCLCYKQRVYPRTIKTKFTKPIAT